MRHKCDEDSKKGKFILTGSTLSKEDDNEEVYHSGAGRIATLKMFPMSLYESKDSTGDISIMDMFNNKKVGKSIKKYELNQLAELIIRGGWPANIEVQGNASLIPRQYIEAILNKDIHERNDHKRDINKMRMLLKSLARNDSSIVNINTLLSDIDTYENEIEFIKSRNTINDYLSVLDSLYLTTYQEAFSINYRSSKRVGKSPKRHLVDPSLSCALLDLSADKLMYDFNTFGFMFESLVEREYGIFRWTFISF